MFPARGTGKPDPKQEMVAPEHPGQSHEALNTVFPALRHSTKQLMYWLATALDTRQSVLGTLTDGYHLF